jgi:hypothetical protein
MRSDMHKVIVERPRRHGGWRSLPRRSGRLDFKAVPLADDDVDLLPSRVGHRRCAALALSYDRKSLNENLEPLRRFLAKQVGRPWNKIWSEISSKLRADNTVQQHVRDHVQDFVATRTHLKDGEIVVLGRWGGPVPLSQLAWPELYVDPRTGLLRRRKTRRPPQRKRPTAREKELAPRLRIVAHDKQLHLLDDGNWWEVRLAQHPRQEKPLDDVERHGLSSLPRHVRYDMDGVYAYAKRCLTRKETNRLRLRTNARAASRRRA